MGKFLLSTVCAAALGLSACGNSAPATDKAATSAVKVDPNVVIKSAQDKRDYAYKKLDNGLKVVVVSDPDADKAAASLDVHIGHMADPADREGLSHYLEHMLFLGTGKYPEVGEYGKFISKHGGRKNAGTGQEHTSYFFSIDNAQLEPALDRFSRFFIDPLFDAEFVQKERNAVESEYSLKVKEDARRYREAVKQTINQAHPMSQFSVGNLETLSDTETSTILETVKAQYEKFYSADIMTLAVVGNYPAEELMAWAEEKFSLVPSHGDNRNLDRPAPYLDDQVGVKVMVNTLENDRSVRLNFALPSRTKFFDKKPVSYITNILGGEAKGSLFDVLKEKGYIKSYYVYPNDVADFTELTAHFNLTDKGYENSDEVIESFFAYVKMLGESGVDKTRYAEIGQIADLGFEFQDKFSVSRFAGNITSNLQNYPPNHALDIGRVYNDFDAKLIQSYLSEITPAKARIIYASPDITSDTKEARYDVAYSMEKISPDMLAKWTDPAAVEGMNLPAANPYIAEDIALNTGPTIDTPKLAYDAPGVKLYYENENEFGLPKSSLNFRIYAKNAFKSDAHMMAISLHSRIVNDMMSAESYPASQAGLYYGIQSASRAYDIGVQGYNDKIDVFLKILLEKFDTNQIDEATFDRLKQNMLQSIENEKFGRPINQAFSMFSGEIQAHTLSRSKRLNVLKGIEYPAFKKMIEELFSAVEIEGTYVGNVKDSDVKDIGKILSSEFKGHLQTGIKPEVESLFLAKGTDAVRLVDIDHNDSAIVWAIQGQDDSYAERAKFALMRQILSQRFYKSLRTEQQYGYVVGLTTSAFDEVPAAAFYIQSPKAHPSVLRAKILEFIEAQADYLEGLTDEEFKGFEEGLLSNINKTFDNVYAKGNTLHRDLIYERYEFDNRAKMTAAVKALSKEDIATFYRDEILDKDRRSMAVWSIGKAHKGEASFDAASYNICKADKCIYKQGE
ncbi:MAG: insulinase family protein [Hellea sp.]